VEQKAAARPISAVVSGMVTHGGNGGCANDTIIGHLGRVLF
jgi:hypothetical protein